MTLGGAAQVAAYCPNEQTLDRMLIGALGVIIEKKIVLLKKRKLQATLSPVVRWTVGASE